MAKVVVLGATGLFGGHLARQLAARPDIELIVAGRTAAPLEQLAQELGATALVMDRATPEPLMELAPFAVVDCSGPFQTYGAEPYAFAKAVLAAGAHYLDIADSPDFVAGITTQDDVACDMGVTAWSGASTTPALTSSIAADLVDGLEDIALIETAILPGNRTKRGVSVMRAILGQVGQPFRLRRGGRDETVRGWSRTRKVALKVGTQSVSPRRAAIVNTADRLLADHFDAQTVTPRAGLELGLFHRTLSIAGLTRLRLDRLARPLLRLADLFRQAGTDVGGMRVRVIGRNAGQIEERVWDMILPDGNGPKTPVQPVMILLDDLLKGQGAPGARPAIGVITRQWAEAQLDKIGARNERRDRIITPIFERALGDDFRALAPQVQDLHRPAHIARYVGEAEVETATSLPARIAAYIGGFPLGGGIVPAEVTIEADGDAETWTREMGHKTFRSTLRYDGTKMTERFGPLLFDLDLHVENGALRFPVTRGRAFGLLPIPRWMTPVSTTSETADAQGRFRFDVRLTLPWGPLIVHYKGYLEPTC
ncbi:saccharopine dehydrogenase-like NADP-dependent oxidoreductase [Litoreibacter ponti]|uniref:Saccharopine dehydrogenase-like NADP-dependent oxidoreductase n=1 Tax=Litoreibacter ponti TaxID=1510457 RepID=A0A2T6BKW8_9RHOB|nr:SDR family oxidoreductase [Litoreibacter ponti]PTX56692.1 saccharopine dehydrogenase-like NADP-dependent oxidoreductase [Litoreibacter ponti]